MGSVTLPEAEAKELLDAQAHLWRHVFHFLNSMALKCALELGIPDTIEKHGKSITLLELANSLAIHPNKVPSLRRLMRLLVSSNFFSKETSANGESLFALTLSSKLLLTNHPLTQAPFALALLDQALIDPSHHLSSWFQNEVKSPFHISTGKSFWEHAGYEPKFNAYFNKAMESDSRFVTRFLVTNQSFRGLFEGVESLVDVGGGNGTTAKAIMEAFPRLKCTVLELPHVIEGIQDNGSGVIYVAGDMFEAVPHGDAVLLKWILHDWSDEDCIKILQRSKEAIPCERRRGKVIIIDMVVEPQYDENLNNTQLLFDMEMMSLTGEGKERTMEEWGELFIRAGFNDYKFLPIMGLRSVIEVYFS